MINEVTKYNWIKKVVEFLDDPNALKLEINFENFPFLVTYFKEEEEKENDKETEA